jgi:hypothetical protein
VFLPRAADSAAPCRALSPRGRSAAALLAVAGGRVLASCTAASSTCSSTCSACVDVRLRARAGLGPEALLQFYHGERRSRRR